MDSAMESDKELLDKALYQKWRDMLIKSAGNICKECDDPRKERAILDFDNPLNCSCRCHRVEEILSRAAKIDAYIKRTDEAVNA